MKILSFPIKAIFAQSGQNPSSSSSGLPSIFKIVFEHLHSNFLFRHNLNNFLLELKTKYALLAFSVLIINFLLLLLKNIGTSFSYKNLFKFEIFKVSYKVIFSNIFLKQNEKSIWYDKSCNFCIFLKYI